jgi:choline-sulfatase
MNLLILMSDEHTRRMTGCYGHPLVKTPNLDRLAERGVRFNNAYVNHPICVPSRANFITGRYTHDTGNWDNAHPYTGHEAEGFGHRLIDSGSQMTTIGKLHYRYLDDPNGLPDSRIAMNVFEGKGDYFGSMRWRRQTNTGGRALPPGPGESHYTRFDRAVTAESVNWLQNESSGHDKPWCLWVSVGCPHPPLVAPEDFYSLYPEDGVDMPINWREQDWPDHPYWNEVRPWRAPGGQMDEAEIRRSISAYYGLVSFMDDNLGKVLDALEASGQAGNTRIIYTTDHGEMLGGYGLWGKMCMYEDSVAIPHIMAGPDLPAGTTCDANISWVDIFPTVLDCAGVPLADPDENLPGTSLWPIARGESNPERIVFSEYHAARSSTGNFMVKDDRYKFVFYAGDYPPQLFDLQEDPTELNDLGRDPAHAETRTRLEAELRKICDPEAVNDRAFADQRALLEKYGGEEAILAEGPKIGATPTPKEFYEDGEVF